MLGGILLALGAVAVLAGMITVPGLLTIWTVVNLTTKRLGAALLNIMHGPAMAGQHAGAKLLPIGWSITMDDGG
jgi:hypothetical protein